MKTPTQNQIDSLKQVVNMLYNLSTELMGIGIELHDDNDLSKPFVTNAVMDIHDEIDNISFKLADIIASAN